MGSREHVYYRSGDIRITDREAQFGATSYAVRHITSVAAMEIPAGRLLPAFFAILAVGALSIGSMIDVAWLSVVSILVLAVAVYDLFTVRRSYAVILTTAAGEVRAYVSRNEYRVDKIVSAIQAAVREYDDR